MASIFDLADQFGLASSPLGDWLPARPTPAPRVSIQAGAAAYAAATRTYTLPFKVKATGLRAQSATVLLLLSSTEPAPANLTPFGALTLPGATASLASQLLVLPEGEKEGKLVLPADSLPGLLGPERQEYYLVLYSGPYQATSADFLFPLPSGSDDCDCSRNSEAAFGVTRYGKTNPRYGPVHKGSRSMPDYPRWEALLQAKVLTASERIIIEKMAPNEGNFDAIQSYDSEIVTMGAMQKTMNLAGTGELPQQLLEFKKDNADLYACLLGNCGWQVAREGGVATMTYTNPTTGKKLAGRALRDAIREGYTKESYEAGKRRKNAFLEPFLKLGANDLFQDKQVYDFRTRLRDGLLTRKVTGTYTIGNYLQSDFGRSVGLDHAVNRPNHPAPYLALALHQLIEGIRPGDTKPTLPAHSEININPALWRSKHDEYERLLLDIYGPLRGQAIPGKSYDPMTHGAPRYYAIKARFEEAD